MNVFINEVDGEAVQTIYTGDAQDAPEALKDLAEAAVRNGEAEGEGTDGVKLVAVAK
jgi:hypothetical protein